MPRHSAAVLQLEGLCVSAVCSQRRKEERDKRQEESSTVAAAKSCRILLKAAIQKRKVSVNRLIQAPQAFHKLEQGRVVGDGEAGLEFGGVGESFKP